MSIEAIKRALKTFEKIHEGCAFVKEDDLHKDAKDLATYVQEDCEFTMKTLRQAIEQAEKQEPVKCNCGYSIGHPLVPKCTCAPRKEWVGLTDEEIAEGVKESWVTEQAFQSAVWWAEAQLKEKNT